MEEHLNHLQKLVPLSGRKVLDLGAGKGEFTIVAKEAGIDVVGIELNPEYIQEAEDAARRKKLEITIIQGVAEKLPFQDTEFDFANVSEVIEHVQDPEKMLNELHRVLKMNGKAYMSVPNRFGMKDPHYHLYFVNWLPRALSDAYIAIFRKTKASDNSAGHQKLNEMHYYTFPAAKKLFIKTGFQATDIRELRIKNEYKGVKQVTFMFTYKVLRPFYFDTFHVLLTKQN